MMTEKAGGVVLEFVGGPRDGERLQVWEWTPSVLLRAPGQHGSLHAPLYGYRTRHQRDRDGVYLADFEGQQ
jgi:hypothetical protein